MSNNYTGLVRGKLSSLPRTKLFHPPLSFAAWENTLRYVILGTHMGGHAGSHVGAQEGFHEGAHMGTHGGAHMGTPEDAHMGAHAGAHEGAH